MRGRHNGPNLLRMGDKRENAESWKAWLEAAMAEAGLRAIDIEKRSGSKENGRPWIDRSRVSQWLNVPSRPSFDLAVRVADILHRPHPEALAAAGYSDGAVMVETTVDGVTEAFIVVDSPEERAALEAFRAGWRAARDSAK
jgi:hypothetical protein